MIDRLETGAYAAGEGSVVVTPRLYRPDGTKTALMFLHAAGEIGRSIQDLGAGWTNKARVLHRLVELTGCPLVACDLGAVIGDGATGTNHWGNANGRARLANAIAYAKGVAVGAKNGPVVALAYSMGNTLLHSFANANPGAIAAAFSVCGVCDVDDIRDNNRGGGLRASIEAANGIGPWTAPGTPPLPAGANPATSHAGMVGVPYRLYYGANDPTVLPSTVLALAAALGPPAQAVSTGANVHGDGNWAGLDPQNLAEFFAPYL